MTESEARNVRGAIAFLEARDKQDQPEPMSLSQRTGIRQALSSLERHCRELLAAADDAKSQMRAFEAELEADLDTIPKAERSL